MRGLSPTINLKMILEQNSDPSYFYVCKCNHYLTSNMGILQLEIHSTINTFEFQLFTVENLSILFSRRFPYHSHQRTGLLENQE